MSQRTGQTCIKTFPVRITWQSKIKIRFVCLPLAQRLYVQHFSVLTTAIDLKYFSTIQQVNLRILRPRIFAKTGTKDCSHITCRLVLPNRNVNIDLSVERTVGIVVATKDGAHTGILTMVIHLCLIDVTRIQRIITISTAKDVIQLNGGSMRNIDHRATGDTFRETATISILHLTTYQVDNSSSFISLICKGYLRLYSHT